MHPNTAENSAQIVMFEQPKKDNSAFIQEINALVQRHDIHTEGTDEKGRLVVSYLFPDKYDKSGFIRQKTTQLIKTAYGTYAKRAAEYKAQNKTEKAEENRKKADTYKDIIRYLELQNQSAKSLSNQQIG